MHAIIARVIGVRQAIDHLIGADRALRLHEGRQCSTWASFDVDPPRILREDAQALCEFHRRSQMRTPVGGIAGLCISEPGARQVRDDRDLRRRERAALEEDLEASKYRLQHARVRRDVDGDADRLNVILRQRGLEPIESFIGSGHDAKLGRIDRRKIEIRRQTRKYIFLGERDTEHAARCDLSEQPAAQMYELDRPLEAQHSGNASGRILSHRVPDEGCGRDAPSHPQARDGDLGDEDRRKL